MNKKSKVIMIGLGLWAGWNIIRNKKELKRLTTSQLMNMKKHYQFIDYFTEQIETLKSQNNRLKKQVNLLEELVDVELEQMKDEVGYCLEQYEFMDEE